MPLKPDQIAKAKRICKRIAKGETVKSACGMEGINRETLRRWIKECGNCGALFKKALDRRKRWHKARRTKIALDFHEKLMKGEVFEYRRKKLALKDENGNFIMENGVPKLFTVEEIEIQKASSTPNTIFELKSTHADYKETDSSGLNQQQKDAAFDEALNINALIKERGDNA